MIRLFGLDRIAAEVRCARSAGLVAARGDRGR
jgi:hypothetical protein